MTEISYDQLMQEFNECDIDANDALWRQSAIAYFASRQLMVPNKTISSDTGKSPSRISQLIKTFEAFPDEATRAKDMTFSIHQLCAETDDPEHWLDIAVRNAYSVRQLKLAISGEKPDPDPIEKAQKLLDAMEKMIEQGGESAEYLMSELTKLLLPNGEAIVS